MQMITKIVFASFLSVFFSACSLSNPSYDGNENLFIKNEKILLSTSKKYLNPAFCIDFAYTIYDENSPYGKLFIESIDLSSNCKWNGFPRGFLQTSMKKYLKITSLEQVEKIDVEGYELSTYKVDNKAYVSLIYKYFGSDEKFIIDYEGVLSESIIQRFKSEYKSKYKNMERYSNKYNKSLVRDNFFESYFSAEREIFRN